MMNACKCMMIDAIELSIIIPLRTFGLYLCWDLGTDVSLHLLKSIFAADLRARNKWIFAKMQKREKLPLRKPKINLLERKFVLGLICIPLTICIIIRKNSDSPCNSLGCFCNMWLCWLSVSTNDEEVEVHFFSQWTKHWKCKVSKVEWFP